MQNSLSTYYTKMCAFYQSTMCKFFICQNYCPFIGKDSYFITCSTPLFSVIFPQFFHIIRFTALNLNLYTSQLKYKIHPSIKRDEIIGCFWCSKCSTIRLCTMSHCKRVDIRPLFGSFQHPYKHYQ